MWTPIHFRYTILFYLLKSFFSLSLLGPFLSNTKSGTGRIHCQRVCLSLWGALTVLITPFYSVGKKCQHWHEDIRFTDRHSVNGDFYKLPGSVTVTAGRQVKGYFRKDFSTVVSWFVNHFLIWKVVVEGGAGENWLHSIINRYVFTLTFYFCHF